VNKLGQPLVTGSVQIMGTNKSADIQADGSFVFDDVKPGDVEIHVASSRYIHSKTEFNIPESGLFDVEIIVEKSSIEILDVTASAFHSSTIESAAPVSVISGDELRKKQASTLGDTLKHEVGVHSSFYGSVASSPIIRGLDGPRVLVTQNGLDSGDASRVGPDHVVATDASTATQIEVLRGPATLFYGSGAIGGVVNVVDQRIPDNNDWEGEVATDRNSNNSEETFSGYVKGGKGNIAFNLQAFYRDSDDYRIPGFAEKQGIHDEHEDEEHEHEEHEGETKGIVENSASTSKGMTLGASYLMEDGHIGFSIEHLSSLYGVPGHAHSEDEVVQGDLQQNRYQVSSKHQLDSEWISAVNTGFAYTDYQHAEIEDGQIGTVFGNKSHEARIEVLHQTIAGWRGGFSFHYKASDFEAIGEEAFTPPSKTKNLGIGLIEEQHFGDVLFQLGARIEKVEIDVPTILLDVPEFVEDHDGSEHDEIEHDDADSFNYANSSSVSFTPLSASIGAVWDFTAGYNLGLSFVHAQRAPSSAEIYSFGPHIGTSTYEIGAFYELNDEGEVLLKESDVSVERSNNIDISLRKFSGDFGFVLNAFYNQVQDYYSASNTGFVFEGGHEHEEEHEEDHEEGHEEGHEEEHEEGHVDELPVFLYSSVDVDLYGFEAQLNWQASASLQIQAQADMVRSKLKEPLSNSRYLARTPPSRLGLSANYVLGDWQAELSFYRYFAQTRLAEFESETDAYSMFDLDVNYLTSFKSTDVTFYLKGRNLANEEARVHTSFLKDLTPVQGRAVILGLRFQF
jgi:iron complex outermembrane receptor protein